jgi:hypothetical protein
VLDRVYRAVAWQRVDQISYTIIFIMLIIIIMSPDLGCEAVKSRGNAKSTGTLGFDGIVGDICMATTSEQTVNTDMKNKTHQEVIPIPAA